MPQLKDVDDKARYENAFFAIGRCAETFYLFAPNIPKNLCQIVQKSADCGTHHANSETSNTLIFHVHHAKECSTDTTENVFPKGGTTHFPNIIGSI